MKQTIDTRLTQHLALTPQLQQAIRLLLLSTQELRQEIEQTMELNPLLEYEDDIVMEAAAENTDENTATEPESELDPASLEITEDSSNDTHWDDIYPAGSGSSADAQTYEVQGTTTDSLRDHLLWQLRLSHCTETDNAIATAIIDAINDDGFLTISLADIHASLGEENEINIDTDEIEAMLHRIQHYDPPGVGARDLKECLLIQLQQYPKDTPYLLEAKLIVEEYLDILGLHDYRQLMRDSKLKENQLSEVINLIQSLNPKPGSLIANSDIEFVIPDAVARKQNNEWVVKINPEALPRVRVNSGYADLLHHNNAPEFQTLKTQLHEARWFLKSIASRNETLLKVAKAIVTRQAEFLEQGDEFMKPLILQTVANDLQMHESTVSRITTQKYLLTPRGVFELKYFFSSHLNTEDGTECSSTAIRAMIKKFIATEDTAKPLSDKRIVDLLTEKGIHVARRTVAKYREEMAIPPSNARKSLM